MRQQQQQLKIVLRGAVLWFFSAQPAALLAIRGVVLFQQG
jgi:hypothetical protein